MVQGVSGAVTIGAPDDAELVRAAQAGHVSSLGLLLARHRAGMRAVALSILGPGPDADDAVQEASLVALRRIGDLRDPQAVAPWLRAVVRNACRMQLRAPTAVPLGDPESPALPDRGPGPDELLDRHAARDWVWHAVGELTPPLRLATMLRYFTDVHAYEQIAELCQVPVGTVRSRLGQARVKLSQALLATADSAHDDVAALTAAHRRDAEDTLRAAHRGVLVEALRDRWSPQVETTWPQGRRTHTAHDLVLAMDRDLGDGVRQRLRNVVAGRDLVIWEADLISPDHDPFHCPPAVAWVQSFDAGRVRRLRLFHPRPVAGAARSPR
jgi:RNA polymerase sigma factor (sigma-70 family)